MSFSSQIFPSSRQALWPNLVVVHNLRDLFKLTKIVKLYRGEPNNRMCDTMKLGDQALLQTMW